MYAHDGTIGVYEQGRVEQSDGISGSGLVLHLRVLQSRTQEGNRGCLFFCCVEALPWHRTPSATLRTRLSSQRWAVTREMSTEKAERQAGQLADRGRKGKEGSTRIQLIPEEQASGDALEGKRRQKCAERLRVVGNE